jgi:hypothetical protein
VHHGAVEAALQPFAQLGRVAPIALLQRPMGLAPDLVGIDEHRPQVEPRELAGDKECRRARLEGDRRPGREGVISPPWTKGFWDAPRVIRTPDLLIRRQKVSRVLCP